MLLYLLGHLNFLVDLGQARVDQVELVQIDMHHRPRGTLLLAKHRAFVGDMVRDGGLVEQAHEVAALSAVMSGAHTSLRAIHLSMRALSWV